MSSLTARVHALAILVFSTLVQAGVSSSPAAAAVPGTQQEAANASEDEAADDGWRGPVKNRNQFPPAFLFISLEPERARVLPKGERMVAVNFDYSNIILIEENDRESLELDLESLRTLLEGRFGLGRNFEVAASLPIYWMYGGFLDPLISDFHNAFGLPNDIREREPDGLFRYSWRVEGTPVLEREEDVVALGDLTLQLKRAFAGKELGATELAARAAVKLPTGSRAGLVSSGRADAGFGMEVSRVGRRVGGFFNLSYHVTSDLGDARSRNFFSWMGAVDWRFKRSLSAVVQYDEFQPILESSIHVLDHSGRQIVFGLRWRRSERFQFEWRFAEDLTSSTSSTAAPDFTVGFQVIYRWKPSSSASAASRSED